MPWDPSDSLGESSTQTIPSVNKLLPSSPYHPGFRKFLKAFGSSIDRLKPHESKLKAAAELLRRPRPDLQLSENEREALCELSRLNSDEDENELVRNFYSRIIHKLLPSNISTILRQSHRQKWNRAVPLHPTSRLAIGQPRWVVMPKPDALFGFSAEDLLGNGSPLGGSILFDRGQYSLTTVDLDVFSPFFGLEFKSQSRRNTLWIAENQEGHAGSIRVRDVRKILLYGRNQDLVYSDRPIYFSLAGDSNVATINLHTAESNNGTVEYTSWRIAEFFLRDKEHVYNLVLAVQNIITYGTEQLADWYRDLFKDCWEVYQETGVHPLASFPLPDPALRKQRLVTELFTPGAILPS